MTRKISFLTIVAGAFLLIAPLSLATQWEVSAQLKLIRIGICLLGAVIALVSGALERLGSASKAMLVFAGVYVLAATWSNYPLQGVAYKMLFFSSLCFGIVFASSVSRKDSIDVNLRILAMVATAAAIFTWYQYLTNPVQSTQVGRLAIWGINANAVGMTAAGYLFLTIYSALNDKGIAKWISAIGSGILAVLLVATGSRAAIALAILGGTFQFVPWLRRPSRLVIPAGIVAIILLAFSANLPVEAVDRMFNLEKNTRAGMWQAGIRLFLQEPVIGHGWLSGSGHSTGNLQNLYFQVFAETGIIGGLALVIAIINIFFAAKRTYAQLSPDRIQQYWLTVAILVGLGVHGIAESAVLLGSTVNTFMLGFALGLLENMARQTGYLRASSLAGQRVVSEAMSART